MKYLILIISIATLTACNSGGSGGNDSDGSGNPGGPNCKSIYNNWQSDTDSEEFDLSGLQNSVIDPDYSYQASNGATCGYPNNATHSLTAQLLPGAVSDAFDYHLKMQATLMMVGTCATYYETGSTGGGRYNAYILDTACNQIEVCKDVIGGVVGNCKLFH